MAILTQIDAPFSSCLSRASAAHAVSDDTFLALEQVRPIARELHQAQPSFVEFECRILRAEIDECAALLQAIRSHIDAWVE